MNYMRNPLIVLFIAFIFLNNINLFSQNASIWDALNYEKNKVLVAAHRGDWKNYPENSLEAIQSCIDRGIDIVEIDVRKTLDGHFILMHDLTVRRTTNGKKKVSKYTLNEIQKLRLRDKNGKITNYHVPSLEEALLVAKGKIVLNLDKSGGYFNELLKVIEKHNCGENIILKGEGPAEFFKKISSNDTTKTLFMPILIGTRLGSDTFVYVSKAPLIEVLLRRDSNAFCNRENLNRIKEQNCKIWYNALFNSISGGHTEGQAAIDSWNWFINHDAKIIQTDYPFELLQYLVDNNLHEKPRGYISADLSKLPNKVIKAIDSSNIKIEEVISNNIESNNDKIQITNKNNSDKSISKNETKKNLSKSELKSQKKYHIVKEGDSLSKIAAKNKTSVKKILKLNPKIKSNSVLKIGSKIIVR